MMKRLPRNSRREGKTIPEFALICVAFFLFLFGILEYARFVYACNLLNNAAREGARFAVTHSASATTAKVQNYVDAYLGSNGASAITNYNKTTSISVYQASTTTGASNGNAWTSTGPGQPIGVTISGSYNFLLPAHFLSLSQAVTISGTAVMYSEAN